ncbi:TnsA-like heteromeric transposase endonuclease subunit [Nocardiopsis alba]|uniref:TnsA-like heteromeric transposase endonuclease subunit n=1 Tax=Nocardiopsis alba TaxID=53437 RepID=UPI00364221A6
MKAVRMQPGYGVQEAGSPGEFEVAFLAPDGTEQRLPLEQATRYPFESVIPVRSFPSFRGQRNNTGWWWTATTGSHVGFESWLERDLLIGFDFDPTVTAISSQPFWLLWHEDGRVRRHAPDFFLRHACGTGSVIDCRPADRIEPRDAAAFATTARACSQMGWRFEVLHAPDPVRTANLRWLSGYKHPRCRRDDLARTAVDLTVEPLSVLELAAALGDPVGTLPTVFHLLWHGELETNLSVPLSENSLVALRVAESSTARDVRGRGQAATGRNNDGGAHPTAG